MKYLTRHEEREMALLYLFSLEIKDELKNDIDISRLKNLPESKRRKSRDSYHIDLIKGVCVNLDVIDDLISENLEDWRLERLNIIDKNILRIAIFEIIFQEDVPGAVAIDEAVEIAKKYGRIESSAFVNGILSEIDGS